MLINIQLQLMTYWAAGAFVPTIINNNAVKQQSRGSLLQMPGNPATRHSLLTRDYLSCNWEAEHTSGKAVPARHQFEENKQWQEGTSRKWLEKVRSDSVKLKPLVPGVIGGEGWRTTAKYNDELLSYFERVWNRKQQTPEILVDYMIILFDIELILCLPNSLVRGHSFRKAEVKRS